jgi:hypothetical protein
MCFSALIASSTMLVVIRDNGYIMSLFLYPDNSAGSSSEHLDGHDGCVFDA